MTSTDPEAAGGPRVARGIVGVLIGDALALPLGLAIAVYLTRTLGPAGYGRFALAASVVTTLEWILAAALARTAVKLVVEALDRTSVAGAIWWTQVALGLSGMAIVWAGAAPIAAILAEPALVGCLLVFAIELPLFSAYSADRTVFVALRRFGPRAASSVMRWSARLVLTVLLVPARFAELGAVLASVGGTLVAVAVTSSTRVRVGRPRLLPLRVLWVHAVPIFLLALSVRLFEKLGLFAVRLLGGSPIEVGWYAAAENFMLPSLFFAATLGPIVLSEMSRARRLDDPVVLRETGGRSLRAVFAVFPFAGLAAGSAGDIVGTVFGAPYAAASPLAGMLVVAGVALAVMSIASSVLIAADRTVEALHLTWPLLPLAIVGHTLAVPRLGAAGAAIVTGACSLLGMAGVLWSIERLTQVAVPFRSLGSALALGGLACIAASAWQTPGAMLAAKLAVLGAGVAALQYAIDIRQLLRKPIVNRHSSLVN
jgi:O-antigen/teichoic acid export membrane protein